VHDKMLGLMGISRCDITPETKNQKGISFSDSMKKSLKIPKE